MVSLLLENPKLKQETKNNGMIINMEEKIITTKTQKQIIDQYIKTNKQKKPQSYGEDSFNLKILMLKFYYFCFLFTCMISFSYIS